MVNHLIVQPIRHRRGPIINEHELIKNPEVVGYGNTTENPHHKTLDCRACPTTNQDGSRNQKRKTTFYCTKCECGYHPECFLPYHEDPLFKSPTIWRKRKN